MGLTISGIIINSLPEFADNEQFAKSKKPEFLKIQLNCLSPKDLSISFVDGCTLIFLDLIFYKNINDKAGLTGLENDINGIFPNSKFMILGINDTSDLKGYSLVENGIKRRTKMVIQDELFLDYGDIYSKEIELYEETIALINEKYPKKDVNLVEEQFAAFGEIERKKNYISLRDQIYRKYNYENKYNYTDGSLDAYLIESELAKIINHDFFEIEQMDFIQFKKGKFNFRKNSLKEFLYWAKSELL